MVEQPREFRKGDDDMEDRKVLLLGWVTDMALIEIFVQYSGRVAVADLQMAWQRGKSSVHYWT